MNLSHYFEKYYLYSVPGSMFNILVYAYQLEDHFKSLLSIHVNSMNLWHLIESDKCQNISYSFETLKYHYTKTTGLICLKFTLCNKDIIRNLNFQAIG